MRVDGNIEDPEVSRYDITIAGKKFNIASRRGEMHIRDVERRLEEIISELNDRVRGNNTLNVALLAALNLADQLVSMESAVQAAPGRFDQQLRVMVTRLMSVIPGEDRKTQDFKKEDTPAVYD